MADKSVRVENFPKDTPGSEAAVAFEMMKYLRATEPVARSRAEYLDLYKECLIATMGHR